MLTIFLLYYYTSGLIDYEKKIYLCSVNREGHQTGDFVVWLFNSIYFNLTIMYVTKIKLNCPLVTLRYKF